MSRDRYTCDRCGIQRACRKGVTTCHDCKDADPAWATGYTTEEAE